MISSALAIAALALYVSSISSSGLRALLFAIPIVALAATLGARFDVFAWMAARTFAAPFLGAIGALTLLAYALANHRSAERSPLRVLVQLGVVAIFLGAGVVAVSFAV